MIYDSAEAAAAACSLDQPIVDSIQGEAFERLEAVDCPLCGNRYPAKPLDAGLQMTAVVAECRACQIAYQALRPSPEATLAYMNWRWASSDSYVADRQGKLHEARRQLDIVNRHSSPGSMLDFGAGSGAFVRVALDAGYDAVGIERSDTAIVVAKERYDVELQHELSGRYDIVTLWDVVEHLRDPEEVLALLHKHMQPGGAIYLTTGNWASWSRMLRGEKRWGLILFDHQYYFTPSSLAKVLDKAGYRNFRLINARPKRPWYSPKRWTDPLFVGRHSIMWARAEAAS